MADPGTRRDFLADWASVFVATLIVTFAMCFVLASFSIALRGDRREDWRAARQRVAFYELVAAGGSNAQTVDARLALDLSSRLNGDDPDAIANFRGTSARYGGITDAIGFDPFRENAICKECGALDADVQADLHLIKRGQLDVLQARIPKRPPEGVRATPFGAPVTAVLFTDLAGSALVVGVPRLLSRQRQRASAAKVRRTFPEQVRVIDDIDRALAHAPHHPDATELRGLRDDVWDYMRRQASAAEDTDDVTMGSMVEQARQAKDYFEARAEARRDLQKGAR